MKIGASLTVLQPGEPMFEGQPFAYERRRMLTNRELATVILAACYVGLISLRVNLLQLAWELCKAAWGKLLVAWCIFVAYLALVTAVAERARLWDVDLLKATIIWVLGAGIALFASFKGLGTEPGFVRRKVLQVAGVTAFLEFFINLTTFSLIWEFLLQGLLTLVGLMLVVAKGDNARVLRRPLQSTYLIVIGGWLLATVVVLSQTWHSLVLATLLRSLALGLWLFLAALPAVWLMSLFAAYENLFATVTFRVSTRRDRWILRAALMLALKFRLRLIWSCNGQWLRLMAQAGSYRHARRIAKCFRDAHTVEAHSLLAKHTAQLRASRKSTPQRLMEAPQGIPGCTSDMTALMMAKPAGWEVLLFAGFLNTLKMTVDRQYALCQLGSRPKTRAIAEGDELQHFTQRHEIAMRTATDLNNVLAGELQQRTFEGDVDAMITLAFEIVSAYEKFRSFLVESTVTAMHQDFANASAVLDRFATQPVWEITSFVEQFTDFASTLSGKLAAGESVEMAFSVTLTVPDQLLSDYYSQLKNGTTTRLAA